MKKLNFNQNLFCFFFVVILLIPDQVLACSTFKLQKGNALVYGHNLNQGDIGVPGMIFINKRGIFKTGHSWSELISKEKQNPSSLCWISRFGSVTVNIFGRDLPDGGMNEAGLYIWEMNSNFDRYPKNSGFPKIDHMNLMQFILDNYSTIEEAIRCFYEIEIDGFDGWHFFIGDIQGNTAAVDFIDGKIKVDTGKDMPIPCLFNTEYSRELELLTYYKGFGGLYEPELSDPKVPRFVKIARLIREYRASQDIVNYGIKMLDQIKVYDEPEWSVLFDVYNRKVYFKTRINPEIKSFPICKIDFSNESPALILNMDIKKRGDVFSMFHPYTNKKFMKFIELFVFPMYPKYPGGFFDQGGLTLEEYKERFSGHSDEAGLTEKQYFKGTWKNIPGIVKDDWEIKLNIETRKDAVSGGISISKSGEFYKIEHIRLVDKNLVFSFHTKRNTLIDVHAIIEENKMYVKMAGIREGYGEYTLVKN